MMEGLCRLTKGNNVGLARSPGVSLRIYGSRGYWRIISESCADSTEHLLSTTIYYDGSFRFTTCFLASQSGALIHGVELVHGGCAPLAGCTASQKVSGAQCLLGGLRDPLRGP